MSLKLKDLKGKYLKHPRMLDTCFLVTSIYEGDTHYKIKGYWFNLGYEVSFQIFPNADNIKVEKEELNNKWFWAINADDVECLRFANWQPLNKSRNETYEISRN